MLDIVLCALPYSNLDHINSAPAILKSVVVENGFTAKTIDFGCELYKLCDKDKDKFYRVQQWFISDDDADSDTRLIIDKFYQNTLNWFKENPSNYIGICVFSRYTHKSTLKLLNLLKESNISSKIVVGGRGLPVAPLKIIRKKLSTLEKFLNFAQLLEKRKLVDHVVIGDGENAILSILRNKIRPTDDNNGMLNMLVPNYDDYDFGNYLFDQNEINLPITGSKGCVRDCDFCDVQKHFGDYRYRSGSDIVHEMVLLSKKYNVHKFQFTDSLVNGGMKPFRDFLQMLSEYNLKNPDKKIKWNGQYICRPAHQTDEDLYKLISASGGEGLAIGAESGSNHVLLAMNKKTDVESLFSELEYFKKYKITCILLLMIGHWSETWEDFIDHCKMIINLLPYVRSGCISALTAHHIMEIPDQTPAYDNRDENNIVLSRHDLSMVWFCKNNVNNTLKERIFRKLIVDKMLAYFRVPSTGELETKMNILTSLENQIELINDFYNEFKLSGTSNAEEVYQNFDKFIGKLVAETLEDTIEVELKSSEFNGKPFFKIISNNSVLFDGELAEGIHTIKIKLPFEQHNLLSMSMYNKNDATDTEVLNGIIGRDKNIILKKIKIGDIDILHDYHFFNHQFSYKIKEQQLDKVKNGFWSNNSCLSINWHGNFKVWYHKNTTRNVNLAGAMKNRNTRDAEYVSNLESKIVNLAKQLYF